MSVITARWFDHIASNRLESSSFLFYAFGARKF